MQRAKVSQRSAVRKPPERVRVTFRIPRTSCTEEYTNAGGLPRLPLSHARSGSSSNSNRVRGWAKVIGPRVACCVLRVAYPRAAEARRVRFLRRGGGLNRADHATRVRGVRSGRTLPDRIV